VSRKAGSPQRLQSVIRIAEDEEKKAFSALAGCREELQGQESKLQDLVLYREEYREGVRSTESFMVNSILKIRNRFSFLQKLEQAIAAQQEQITAWKEHESLLHQAWMEKRIRRRALNKASSQRQEQVRRHQQRREQKQSDEFSRSSRQLPSLG